jgi:serine/threonine protein kinase
MVVPVPNSVEGTDLSSLSLPGALDDHEARLESLRENRREYLEGFETLSNAELDSETMREVFGLLRRLHENGLAHGDFSLENVLIVGGEAYFIDSTNVSEEGHDDAVAYDLACALGAFSSRVTPSEVVDAASEFFDAPELRRAADLLIVVRLRPGIEEGFSVREIRGAVEEAVEADT